MNADTQVTLATIFGTLFGGGGLAAVVKVLLDRKAGVKGDEREARRDMVADRDGLIDTLFRQTADLNKRVTRAEQMNTFLRDALVLFSDHIDALESHIYAASRGEVKLLPFPARPRAPKHKEDPEDG